MNASERESFHTCGFCMGMGGTAPNGFKYCNCAENAEVEAEREIIRMLGVLQADYRRAAEPFIQRLIYLRSIRSPRHIISDAQLQALRMLP